MRKGLFLSVLCMSAGMLTVGCAHSEAESEKDNVISLEGYSFDYVADMKNTDYYQEEADAESRYMRVSGELVLPVTAGSEQLKVVRDSLLSWSRIAGIEDGKVTPVLDFGGELTDMSPKQKETISNSYTNLSVCHISPKIVSWSISNYIYFWGSAHGFSTTRYANYSFSTHKLLALSDIFKEDAKPELDALVREKLKEEDVALSVPLNEVSVSQNFKITDNGIEFLYDPYEIAPYAAGSITVEIGAYQLADLVKPEYASLFRDEE